MASKLNDRTDYTEVTIHPHEESHIYFIARFYEGGPVTYNMERVATGERAYKHFREITQESLLASLERSKHMAEFRSQGLTTIEVLKATDAAIGRRYAG